MAENKRNYQKELDRLIEEKSRQGEKPKLLLHACCAPCSSYCLEYLSQYFDITLFFYNPNISPEEEYNYRAAELKNLVSKMPCANGIEVIVEKYDYNEFLQKIAGYENEPERGSRCSICYRLRLEKAAELAKSRGFDYFTTTLSISPYKDADRLVKIGEELGKQLGIPYLVSDFKKKNGYKRSIELSEEYNLYRQSYCGCSFSKK
ncbi:MAG: epoxyqueuosine reductase QueH [Lachnospiraceae bacterium]